MARIEFIEGGTELLEKVGPLWEMLNRHHELNSEYFSHKYANMKFQDRKKGLLEKAKTAILKVELAQESIGGDYIGYCIYSLTNDGIGEIESIFIDPIYRGLGVGDNLMKGALHFLKSNSAKTIRIGVAGGNEQVFSFYSRYGFYPRTTILEQVK